MPSLSGLLTVFLDFLTGHLVLAVYLLAVTDERAVRRRLKKFPLLILSPLLVALLFAGLSAVPELRAYQYFIISFAVLLMCSLWVRWAWRFSFWKALAATCMAGIFQVATATLSWMLWAFLEERSVSFVAAAAMHLCVGAAVSLLLYKLRFGVWFRLLLDHEPAPWRIALLLSALEAVMEMLLQLAHVVYGARTRFMVFYYLLVTAMAVLMAALVVYLAQRFDAARKMREQQEVIARQRLYEQDLEMIRREVRAFRHDYKNLLAGLSEQAESGELEELRHALSELDTGFDLRLGRKIQASVQIGNLQIPEVRSLLINKLAVMREKGIECRLEVLYPVAAVGMDVWDFVRCLGILIDNAMEAAPDAEQAWVEILLLAQEERVFLRISNPYANPIEPGKMWDEGWSTKGAGRGLGLPGYQRILERYPNCSSCTSWENGVFVQELAVEGRP